MHACKVYFIILRRHELEYDHEPFDLINVFKNRIGFDFERSYLNFNWKKSFLIKLLVPGAVH